MGATFSRVKNWTTEVLSDTDLNAEVDNILNNLTPSGTDDYSATAAQMRTDTDGGESGTESLATSLAGELERLRFAIREIKGSGISYWYQSANTSLTELNSALSTTTFSHRIVSGQSRTSGSSQALFLTCNGTTTSLILSAAGTNFVYYVQGTQTTRTANSTLSSLTAAPSTNNTAAINSTLASGQQWTKTLGEYGTTIPIDGAGSEFATLVGKYAAFKIGAEILLGYLDSTTAITQARRGYFFDSTNTPLPRVVFSDNAEVKLLKLAWIFINTSGALQAVYTNPSVASGQPTSPAFGDYWFDLVNAQWKTYALTATWDNASASLIGVAAQDTTACIGTRSFDFFKNYSSINTLEPERISNTEIKSLINNAEVSVFGSLIRFNPSVVTWDMATDIDADSGETASQNYYCYKKENGASVISDMAPHDRRADLRGYYHPFQTWRCIANGVNDASSNLTTARGVDLVMRPTVQAFNSTGAGTYVTPIAPKPLFLKVTLVGPGGGGSGGGATTGAGGNGIIATSFDGLGVSLTANVGSGGNDPDAGAQYGGNGGSGLATGANVIVLKAVTGGIGGGVAVSTVSGNKYCASHGGYGPRGGAGGGGQNGAGTGGAANTGGGGGGGSGDILAGTVYFGSGGGAGGYVEAIIRNPTGVYAYMVGGGGVGGTGSNASGGVGASGALLVEEYYSGAYL